MYNQKIEPVPPPILVTCVSIRNVLLLKLIHIFMYNQKIEPALLFSNMCIYTEHTVTEIDSHIYIQPK